MRTRIFALLPLLAASLLFGQSQYVQFTSTNIVDAAGNKLASGTFTVTPVNNAGTPIAPQMSGGGRVVPRPVVFKVVNGVIQPSFGAAQLVDVNRAFASPFCYADSIHDNISGDTWSPDPCLQPSYSASWCSVNGGVTTCNYDNYQPTSTPGVMTQAGPTGPQGVQGAQGLKGDAGTVTCAPGTCGTNGDYHVGGALTEGPLSLPVPPRYQISLASNIGLVQVLPYGQPITTGSANFGPSTGQTSRNWIDFGHLYRARQNGTVTQVKVNVPSIAGITGFYISNCRSGAVAATTPNNVDVITTSQNMALSLISGVNTLTLSSPLNMQWGDYICGRIEWSGGATVQNLATSPATSATGETAAIYYVDNVIPSATSYDWTAVSSSTGNVMLVEADMTPPLFACTADSIGSGAITAYSFSDTYSTLTAGNVSYCDLVGLALNVPVQNFGHAGFTTNQIWTEFAKGPAKVAPKYVVLEGGVNDILGGTETLAQIQTQWTNILNSTQALGAVPIVLGILPFSSGGTTPPTAQMQLGDQVNAWLASQTAAYGGIYVNTAPYLGLYDPRGPAGNLWLMNTQYYPNGSGNVHPGPLGYKRVAQAILDGLSASNSIGNPPAPPATSFAAGTGDSTGMVRSFGVGTYSSGSPAAEMYYSGAAFFDCYNRPSTPCVTNVGITSVGGSGISFGLSQTATMYGNFQLSNGQFTGLLQGAGMMRSTGSSTTGATAGLGAEMFVSGSTGIFDCYNRTAAAACKAQFGQSTVGMTADPTGNAVLIFGSTLTVAPNTTFTSQITHGASGSAFTAEYKGSGTLTYTSITAPGCQEQPLTITGAGAGDECAASPGASDLGISYSYSGCRVSAINTAQVKVCAMATGTPAAVTWTGWARH